MKKQDKWAWVKNRKERDRDPWTSSKNSSITNWLTSRFCHGSNACISCFFRESKLKRVYQEFRYNFCNSSINMNSEIPLTGTNDIRNLQAHNIMKYWLGYKVSMVSIYELSHLPDTSRKIGSIFTDKRDCVSPRILYTLMNVNDRLFTLFVDFRGNLSFALFAFQLTQ